MTWILLLSIIVALVYAARPWAVVHLEGGAVRVARGRLPGALVEDLRVIAGMWPAARGRVELRGRGTGLSVRTPGLDEGIGQQVRNVVHLRRRDLA